MRICMHKCFYLLGSENEVCISNGSWKFTEECQPKAASGQKYASGFDVTTARLSKAIEAIMRPLSCTQLASGSL